MSILCGVHSNSIIVVASVEVTMIVIVVLRHMIIILCGIISSIVILVASIEITNNINSSMTWYDYMMWYYK